MKVYVTGNHAPQALEPLMELLRAEGHTVSCYLDVVQDHQDDHQNLVDRLQAVLNNDAVVTTGPNHGGWSEGSDRELNVARAARIPVYPAMTAVASLEKLAHNLEQAC